MGLTHLAGRTVTHKGTVCDVYLGFYDNDRAALQLVERETQEPWARATVNVPDEPLESDEAFIKDYSENEGMLDALVEAGLARPTGRVVYQGHVQIPVVKLLLAPAETAPAPEGP